MSRHLASTQLMLLILLAACSSELGAPFPATFYMKFSDEFEFVAAGTSDYRANTSEGEKGRMDWLSGYLARNHICPFGYDIIDRQPEPVTMSPKANVEEQSYRSITYIGRCRPPGSTEGRLSSSPRYHG